jgi:hypothetical protein
LNPISTAWAAEIVLISYRDWQGKGAGGSHRLPWPSELLATFILYGILSLAPPGSWRTAAAALGWGFVAATYLGIYNPEHAAAPGTGGTPANPLAGVNLPATSKSGPVVNGIYFPPRAA